jgi:hypothetical protein
MPRAAPPQLWERGLWDTASSSTQFSMGKLKLQQSGQTVTGSFKGGHLYGKLPRGSSMLSGRWRNARRDGNIVVTFSSDGRTFQGTWSFDDTSGSIIGRRIIAASPALR